MHSFKSLKKTRIYSRTILDREFIQFVLHCLNSGNTTIQYRKFFLRNHHATLCSGRNEEMVKSLLITKKIQKLVANFRIVYGLDLLYSSVAASPDSIKTYLVAVVRFLLVISKVQCLLSLVLSILINSTTELICFFFISVDGGAKQ